MDHGPHGCCVIVRLAMAGECLGIYAYKSIRLAFSRVGLQFVAMFSQENNIIPLPCVASKQTNHLHREKLLRSSEESADPA